MEITYTLLQSRPSLLYYENFYSDSYTLSSHKLWQLIYTNPFPKRTTPKQHLIQRSVNCSVIKSGKWEIDFMSLVNYKASLLFLLPQTEIKDGLLLSRGCCNLPPSISTKSGKLWEVKVFGVDNSSSFLWRVWLESHFKTNKGTGVEIFRKAFRNESWEHIKLLSRAYTALK